MRAALRVGLLLGALVGAGAGGAGSAAAGPIADFEAALQAALAHFRVAVVATGPAADKAMATRELSAFLREWEALTRTWGATPPPHYSEDTDWRGTIESVAVVAADARQRLAVGTMAEAHDNLEEIRDILADLRRRNGVVRLADPLDAVYEQLDAVLETNFSGLDAARRANVREQVAVLQYLVRVIRQATPDVLATDEEFHGMVDDLEAAVDSLYAALGRVDGQAAAKAAKSLPPAYARLFLKYG